MFSQAKPAGWNDSIAPIESASMGRESTAPASTGTNPSGQSSIKQPPVAIEHGPAASAPIQVNPATPVKPIIPPRKRMRARETFANSMRKIALSNALLAVALLTIPAEPASAQCTMCAPIVSESVGSPGSPSAVDVHWLPGGGTPPQRVALVNAGTAQKGYLDGKTLASASETSSLGQYSSYDLHATVPANTIFAQGTLHVIGFWGNESIPSAGFGASTQAPSGGSPITIIQALFDQYGRIDLAWTGSAPDHYNVRWSAGTVVASNAAQIETKATSWFWRPDGPGPYTFSVQGCDRTFWGNSVLCSKWAQPKIVNAATLPPPKITSLSFKHDAKGDCELDGATIQFKSNGSGQFSARVKTNHTTSGDVWHTTITGRNLAGQTIVSLPTFDSMRMDDNHGYYPWTVYFEFDPTKWSQIESAHSENSC